MRTGTAREMTVRTATAAVPVVALCAALVLGGCSPAPGLAAEVAPAVDTGAVPGSWVEIPSGPFQAGPFGTPASVDHAYEIMVFPVTNAEYARYLNQAQGEGKVKVVAADGGEDAPSTGPGPVACRVLGYYPGDAFHGGKHEKEVPAGDQPYLLLDSPVSRIVFDGRAFGVRPGYDDHPVTMVTWFGAKAYAEFYGYRLPTEDEWEKAARGTDGRPYPWGAGIQPGQANYYHSRDPFERPGQVGDTTPVGFYNGRDYGGYQTIDSVSPYGLYDMAGNVAEWAAGVYEGTHQRYLRGGSKAEYAYDLRSWTRRSAAPDYASPNVGFRCVRTPVP